MSSIENEKPNSSDLAPAQASSPTPSVASVRGRLLHDADLSRRVWLKCGGAAASLFEPADEEDLLAFVKRTRDARYRVLGAGSNVLVADGGVDGVVVATSRLSRLKLHDDGTIEAGAGAGLGTLARFAGSKARSGLAFFASVPGTVGGAVRMNAGAEGSETKEVLAEARVLDTRTQPVIRTLACDDLAFRYRGSNIEEGMIVLSARFRTRAGDKAEIAALMTKLREKRQRTQPIREKTGGSTFKNPDGYKAWKLIEQAGMRGARYGGAEVSKKHCNFLVNTSNAKKNTAMSSDFWALGERVRAAVFETSGIRLEWEIVRMGFDARWNEERDDA